MVIRIPARPGENSITILENDFGLPKGQPLAQQEFYVGIKRKSGNSRLLRVTATYHPSAQENMTHKLLVEMSYQRPDGTCFEPTVPWVRKMHLVAKTADGSITADDIMAIARRWYSGSTARLFFRPLEFLTPEYLLGFVH